MNLVQLVSRNSRNRSLRHAILFFHTHKDVATAKIVKVVGESTDGMIYGYWIPTLLEFNTVGFHLPLVQEVFYVDR